MSAWLILFVAILLDRRFGEPDLLWSRLPHPIVLFGKAVGWTDRTTNLEGDSDALRYRKGALAITALIILAVATGLLLEAAFSMLGPFHFVGEIFIVFVLLAQKSLLDHVSAVAVGLRSNGIAGGRQAVAMIVGRNPASLDRKGVSRAAIETLGENFSDGVVAPAFWYIVFGLPGILAYKMINTADSMIAYRTPRHEHFGKTAAWIDDLANWLPARLSAVMIAAGAWVCEGMTAARRSLVIAFRDAGLHRSPNAGWPEAALAGACNVALGGPRIYPGETVAQSHLNAAGRLDLDAGDIDHAIRVIAAAGWVLAGFVLAGFVFADAIFF